MRSMPEEIKKEELKVMLEKVEPAKAAPRMEKKPLTLRPKISAPKAVIGLVVKQFPNLRKKLEMADITEDPRDFISKVLINSIGMTLFVLFFMFILASIAKIPTELVFILSPAAFFIIFTMGMGVVDVKINQRSREVERDVLFAGRDILIALKSGVPLFNALVGVRKDYGATSKEFAKIVEKIDSGVPAEVTLQESYENNKSQSFRRIILQILISLRSGSDIATGLDATLAQISQEQIIEIKRYGQKLNPIAMFYMLFAIIIPSLGVAIGVILSSFVSIDIDFSILVFILIVIGFIQYTFVSIIKSSRPSFDI